MSANIAIAQNEINALAEELQTKLNTFKPKSFLQSGHDWYVSQFIDPTHQSFQLEQEHENAKKQLITSCKKLSHSIKEFISNEAHQNDACYEYYKKVLRTVIDNINLHPTNDNIVAIMTLKNGVFEFRSSSQREKIRGALALIAGALSLLAAGFFIKTGIATTPTGVGMAFGAAGIATGGLGCKLIYDGITLFRAKRQAPIQELNEIEADLSNLRAHNKRFQRLRGA